MQTQMDYHDYHFLLAPNLQHLPLQSLTSQIDALAVTSTRIASATRKDSILSKVLQFTNGKPLRRMF